VRSFEDSSEEWTLRCTEKEPIRSSSLIFYLLVCFRLMQFREFGIMDRLKRKYWPKRIDDPGNTIIVDIEDIYPILLFLAIGIVIAMAVFIMEILVRYYFKI